MKMNLSLAQERALRILKFGHGLPDETLQTGMEKPFTKASELIQPFELKMLQIGQDRSLSQEGKTEKKEIKKKDMLSRVDAWRTADLDKSEMIIDLTNRKDQKVASTRKTFRPENDVLAFLTAQEIRQNYLSQQKEFDSKTGTTVAEKQEQGPLLQSLMAAAAGYVADPRTQEAVEQNKRHEITLTALLDSPVEIVPQDYRNAVNTLLADRLAANEVVQVREAIAFNEALSVFADDIKQIVEQA